MEAQWPHPPGRRGSISDADLMNLPHTTQDVAEMQRIFWELSCHSNVEPSCGSQTQKFDKQEMMMKKFVLTTAILAGLSGAAFAQDAAAPGKFRTAADAMELRASKFIGMRVYATETEMDSTDSNGMQDGWNDIGEINDVIMSRDGNVDAVLVDIGGFLGMGERQVAVSMSAIKFVSDSATGDAPDDFFLVMNANRADLESAPDYSMGDNAMVIGNAEASGNGAAPNDGTAATTDGTVAADTTANGTEPAAAAGTMRQPVARDGYMAAEKEYLTAEKLTGAKVYDANDEVIGEVGKLILSDSGQITDAVIDVGGFLGMGEKPVALKLTDIDILRNEAGDDVRVYLTKTKVDLEAMPNFEG